MHVEASVGISLYPAHGNDADSLMRRADVAMYQAKRGHTRYQIYERQRDPYSAARLALLGDLRRAVERGELNVVYQPQRTTESGEIQSVEALVRWQHPQRGELPPDEFIGLAERSEVIHALTRFVLERAIEQCAAWARDGRDVRVAVNLSARNLHDALLAPDIATMLQTHGLPASRLELEITETSIEADPHGTEELLTRLHDMGVGIAIDDFGTGYSAFSYLQRLPVDEIKIDRSFVMGMEADRRKHQIVRSTIQLGHNLGLRVVAEGVELDVVERGIGRSGLRRGAGLPHRSAHECRHVRRQAQPRGPGPGRGPGPRRDPCAGAEAVCLTLKTGRTYNPARPGSNSARGPRHRRGVCI